MLPVRVLRGSAWVISSAAGYMHRSRPFKRPESGFPLLKLITYQDVTK